jgi:threonine synthase
VFVSTASPLKFGASVCDALFGNGYSRGRSEAVLLDELSTESGLEIPAGLAGLAERPVLHTKTITPSGMKEEALRPF